MRRQVSYQDLLYSTINNQNISSKGTSFSITEPNAVYFILSVDGANDSNPVTFKNSAGSVVYTAKESEEYHWPFRIDGGFQASASDDFVIVYSEVNLGNQ